MEKLSRHIIRMRTDIKFFINRRYNAILNRTNNDYHGRGYLSMEVCSRNEFMDFSINDKILIELYKNWGNCNFSRKSAPSIDRLDNTQGYVIGNLQWITQSENSKKDKGKRVELYYGRMYIKTFNSITEASRYAGVCRQNLSKTVNGERKHAGGYKCLIIN